MRLAGIVFAALFWNGIMSFFVYQAWQEYARGRTDWFLILFLVPFVLVGIGLVFGIGYGILALRNPKPELVVQPADAAAGGFALDLQWRFQGNAQRLQQVRIVLRGEERATYTVGTNTHTATETFFERVLTELPAPACGMGGHVRVEIPATFHAQLRSRTQCDRSGRWRSRETSGAGPTYPRSTRSSCCHGVRRGERVIEIRTDGGETAFAPGETLRGDLQWMCDTPPRRRSACACSGTPKGAAIATSASPRRSRWERPSRAARAPSASRLPSGPYSCSGQLVSVRWAIEAVSDSPRDVGRLELVLGPDRREVVLGEDERG